ncbi:hypothetical protein ACFVRD_32995 [Streptomyces sp. NPDC057908]|uniref:hypothetical protein n=1 Tax=Streptomyces sp. NPDC057908 TaxID=3346276 RepID=UPI0036EDF5A5
MKTWLEAQLALVATEMVTVDEVLLPYLTDGSGQPLYDNYWEREALVIATTVAALFAGGPENVIELDT